MTDGHAFDFVELRARIVAAAVVAYDEISARQTQDPLRAFALYSDAGAMTVRPAMATASYLAHVRDDEDSAYYTYSPSEWPLEGEGAQTEFTAICAWLREHLSDLEQPAFVRFRDALMRCCVESARELRLGHFANLGDDFLLLVTVSDEDEPAQTLNARVAALNSARVAAEFAEWSGSW